jgi:hypothetical protein
MNFTFTFTFTSYRGRESGERYGQNVCILATTSAFGNLQTWVVGLNPAAGLKQTPLRFVTLYLRKKPILPTMESTKQTPIYEIVIIQVELSEATLNIPFPYACGVASLVTNILDRTFSRNFFFSNATTCPLWASCSPPPGCGRSVTDF